MIARLARSQIPVQVDIGFGDIVTPAPTLQVYKGRPSPETDTLDVVIRKLREFLEPVLAAAVENKELDAIWKPGGPWQSSHKVK